MDALFVSSVATPASVIFMAPAAAASEQLAPSSSPVSVGNASSPEASSSNAPPIGETDSSSPSGHVFSDTSLNSWRLPGPFRRAHEEPLRRFSHCPPSSVRGLRRWPQGYEQQTPLPNLEFCLHWLAPYLTAQEHGRIRQTQRALHLGWQFGPLPFCRPWAPLRRRRWGFGVPSKHRVVTRDDTPVCDPMLHFVWQYLAPADRLACSLTSPNWLRYHLLRQTACVQSVASLRHCRPPVGNPLHLSMSRSVLYGCALLLFHFIYGDLIRWLGGEYTNRHRNWDATFQELAGVCSQPPPPHLPPVTFSRCKQACVEGVPLVGKFHSPTADLKLRDAYDNHPAVASNIPDVMTKFAKEEEKTFHIHFPRFLLYFVQGVMLNPLQWAVRKGKGRICVDCTNARQGKAAPGSPNTYIPSPSEANPDECPPVYYANAFMRHLRMIWRLRATFPLDQLRQHVDDIDAAFRRVLYHPDLALVFGYVFTHYWIVPVGQVFGSRSAPSYFSMLSDLRAYVATCGDLSRYPMPALVDRAAIPDDASSVLAPAVVDSLNPLLTELEIDSYSNQSFVDDNGIVDRAIRILQALHQSVLSAYILFGQPGSDRRGSCFAVDKFEELVSVVAVYLGFEIDCDQLIVSWPREKREALFQDIASILALPRGKDGRTSISPKLLASIIGKLQSVGIIAPFGPFLTFPLNSVLRKALARPNGSGSWWWSRGKVRLGRQSLRHLESIQVRLLDDSSDYLWSCSIGLIIPREATIIMKSDASYAGLGGWSPTLRIQWRVMTGDLIALGFPMKNLQQFVDEPLDVTSEGLHINPLEFMAAIINIWLLLKLLPSLPTSLTGHIVDLFSDNTSCLSWCKYTTVMQNAFLQPWARLVAHLLILARQQQTRIQPIHIPGKDNDEADILSRSVLGHTPSWAYVTEQCSQLGSCQICLLPPELLSVIAGLLSSPPTEAMFAEVMIKLLILEPAILPLGSRQQDTRSSLRD